MAISERKPLLFALLPIDTDELPLDLALYPIETELVWSAVEPDPIAIDPVTALPPISILLFFNRMPYIPDTEILLADRSPFTVISPEHVVDFNVAINYLQYQTVIYTLPP